nr:MAG TPA: hypothetical protein [Caudoviricetes sp.]
MYLCSGLEFDTFFANFFGLASAGLFCVLFFGIV